MTNFSQKKFFSFFRRPPLRHFYTLAVYVHILPTQTQKSQKMVVENTEGVYKLLGQNWTKIGQNWTKLSHIRDKCQLLPKNRQQYILNV